MIGLLSLAATSVLRAEGLCSCAVASAALTHLSRTIASGATSAVQTSSTVPWQSLPSAEHVFAELENMERSLRRRADVDGSKRMELSTNALPNGVFVPKHSIEPGLMSIDVHLRPELGSTSSKWLQKIDRVAARVTSLHNNSHLYVHMQRKDADKLVREYGLNGCEARVVQLRVLDAVDPAKELSVIRVKPQEVRRTATNLQVQNVEFLYCPQSRAVRVNVPIKLVNADASVGVRKGAWLQSFKRTVAYRCKGFAIPPYIEVDVKALDVDQAVRVRDLAVPDGTMLIHQDFDALVVKCTTEVSEEISVR